MDTIDVFQVKLERWGGSEPPACAVLPVDQIPWDLVQQACLRQTLLRQGHPVTVLATDGVEYRLTRVFERPAALKLVSRE